MGLGDEVVRLYTVDVPSDEFQARENEIAARRGLTKYLHLRYDSQQNDTCIPWIEGLKGIVTFQGAIWLFLRTFAPATVYAGVLASEPTWQTVLRRVFSPICWDGLLQWSFIIILSGRVVATKFCTQARAIYHVMPLIIAVHKSTADVMAGSIFRRPFRFVPAVTIAMSISAALNLTRNYDHITDFQTNVGSTVTSIPFKYQSVLAWLNSMFNLFWFQDALQAEVLAQPAGQLWIITTCFLESYTIHMTMLLLPYMTRRWRVQVLLAFIVAAWWINSWAWYSITGLVICDNFGAIAEYGAGTWDIVGDKPKFNIAIPRIILPITILVLGVYLKYLYADGRPSLADEELNIYTSTYLVGGLIEGYVNYSRPQMRVDNYLVVTSTLVLVEMCPRLQKILAWRPFQYLRHISLSIFLLQRCITYTVGISLFNKFVGAWERNAFSACCVISVVDFSILWLCSDIYAPAIDHPSRRLASVIH